MQNFIVIEGRVKTIDIANFRFFMIENEKPTLKGEVWRSPIKVSLYLEEQQKSFREQNIEAGNIVRVEGWLKVNLAGQTNTWPSSQRAIKKGYMPVIVPSVFYKISS